MKPIVALRNFANAPKNGGRITFMAVQTGCGREPSPSLRLLCAVYLRTSLEKERNGPQEGRKREKVFYLKLHIIYFLNLLERICVKGTHLRHGTISLECVTKNMYDHNRELLEMSPEQKK